MRSVIEFLKKTKTDLADIQNADIVHVVIGNESCDLDSAVCALVQAYIISGTSVKEEVQAPVRAEAIVIPVLNIPQQKYHLKTETRFLFRSHGIYDELLTFCDQINLHNLHLQRKLRLSLVDHNVLPGTLSGLDDSVVFVVDHRPQVRTPDGRVKINIASVGSCATLVAEELLDLKDFKPDNIVLELLYGTILIDTVNLSKVAGKRTDRDFKICKRLKDLVPDVNAEELYNNILKAKTDIKEMSTMELFEKDFKVVSGKKVRIGISSISLNLEDFLSRDNLLMDLEIFTGSLSLNAVVIMMIYRVSEEETPSRDLAVYCVDVGLQQKICDSLECNKDPSLELISVTSNIDQLAFYHQGSVKASRKLVLPIIQNILDEYETLNIQTDEQSNNAMKSCDSFGLLDFPPPSSQNQFQSNENRQLDSLEFTDQTKSVTNVNLIDDIEIFTTGNDTNVQTDAWISSENNLVSKQSLQNTIDLLGSFDPFSSKSGQPVGYLSSQIPEISISQGLDVDELNEADIMFHSSNLDVLNSGMNSTSQGSSAHTSEPGSAFASYPVTPPNSYIDLSGQVHMKDFTLPSLNSAEMMEKIKEKKLRLGSSDSMSTDATEGSSVPFTPQNSYMEVNLEQYAKEHQLPSFNSMEMVQRIQEKRSSMETSRLGDEEDTMVRLRSESGEVTPFTPQNSYMEANLEQYIKEHQLPSFNSMEMVQRIQEKRSSMETSILGGEEDTMVRLRSESGEVTPFTPQNSYRDTSFLDKHATLDTNKLEQKLHDTFLLETKESNQTFNEGTNSRLLTFDASNLSNPTYIHMNVVAVQLAQEMVQRETTTDDLFISLDEAPSDGGSGMKDLYTSNQRQQTSNVDSQNSGSTNSFQKGGNSDTKTETLLLHQSIDEFAQNLTGKLIEEAINSFPEQSQVIEESEMVDVSLPEKKIEHIRVKSLDFASTEPPSKVVVPDELPVETDYLSRVDPLHGNLNLVKTGADNQEIVESISFRKISGEAPQTVRQEILHQNKQVKVEKDMDEVREYAAQLVQQVISGAIETVTMTSSHVNKDSVWDVSSEITEESGVTWSREESFETVSSIPSQEGRHVTWSNQGSLDNSLSGAHSFDLDQMPHSIKHSGDLDELSFWSKNGKQSHLGFGETQELNDFLSPSSIPNDKVKDSVSRQSGLEAAKDCQNIENLQTAEQSFNKPGLHSKMESDYMSSKNDILPLKLENTSLENPSQWSDSVPCMESFDYISSEGETDNSTQKLSVRARPTYLKADTLDYISSEGEGQEHEFIHTLPEMYNSQSSDPTSTTTEGSYQVLSPDQQLNDIKGELSDFIKSEMSREVTQLISAVTEEICVMDKNREVTNENLCTDNNDIQPQGSLDMSKTNKCHGESSVFEETLKQESAKPFGTNKEIYITSAGRISITSDGGDNSKHLPSVTDSFIEESHDEDNLSEKQEDIDRKKVPPDIEQSSGASNNKPDIPVNQQNINEGTDKPVKRGMDLTEEWHEDPIPGMNYEDNDTDSTGSRSRHSSGSSESSDSSRPANRPTSLQTNKKKRISVNFNILKEDYTSPDDIDTTDNAGDLEWENDTPVSIPSEPIEEYSAKDEFQDAKHWRGVEVNGKQLKIDLRVIDPYKKVLTHGGYYGDGLNAIIVFSGCYLPDRNRKDYQYVMDNLFLYVISTLELLVAEDYMIVYFHGATPRRQMPSFGWLKKCYQMIDRRLKKNLKGLLLIHPTLWLRTIVLMTKPFISSKFSSKLRFVRTLHELSTIVPMEYIFVPDQVQKYDSNLLQQPHSSPSAAPHTPT